MRVISGIYRSRILEEVPTSNTRETKDRVKESMFNSLQPHLYDARVLDLFAGSGSLGIEAISRGSKHVFFVDSNPVAVQVIQRNLNTLGISNQSNVVLEDYHTFLHHQDQPYDIILLDPPYDLIVLDEVVAFIATHQLLLSDGIIVMLYGKNSVINPTNNGIIEYKKKTIGITNLSFMKWGS